MDTSRKNVSAIVHCAVSRAVGTVIEQLERRQLLHGGHDHMPVPHDQPAVPASSETHATQRRMSAAYTHVLTNMLARGPWTQMHGTSAASQLHEAMGGADEGYVPPVYLPGPQGVPPGEIKSSVAHGPNNPHIPPANSLAAREAGAPLQIFSPDGSGLGTPPGQVNEAYINSETSAADRNPDGTRHDLLDLPLEIPVLDRGGHDGQGFETPVTLPGEIHRIYGPHHTGAGHPNDGDLNTDDTHYFDETGDGHHFAWQDRDTSTPNADPSPVSRTSFASAPKISRARL